MVGVLKFCWRGVERIVWIFQSKHLVALLRSSALTMPFLTKLIAIRLS